MSSSVQHKPKNLTDQVDWAFLFFLLTLTNVKLYIKVFSIFFYLVWIKHKKYKAANLPDFSKFYFLMPVIGTLGAVWSGSFAQPGYWFGYMLGVTNWIIAGVGCYFLYVAVTNLSRQQLMATVQMFFLLNSIVSVGELGKMILDSGQLVPYWYWEPTEYYGGSTGDHILGITGNISVTNATLNAIGIVFFLLNDKSRWAFMCMVILLLCTSNMTLILLLALMLFLFVVVNRARVRRNIIGLLLITGVIYPTLTLNNIKYVDRVYSDEVSYARDAKKRPAKDSIADTRLRDYLDFGTGKRLDEGPGNKYFRLPINDTILISFKDELKYIQKLGRVRSRSNTNLRLEPDSLKKLLERWYKQPYQRLPLSNYKGIKKFYTFKQTWHYMKQSKRNMLFGAGIGNFSSKLAIKSTGIGIQGDYPVKYVYLSKDYIRYHLFSFVYLFSMPIAEHSILNMVNSVYNQVAGEYGLAGCLLFVVFYLGYVFKHRKYLRSGIYLTLLMLAFFVFEYWFEMVSLTVIFELFILLEVFAKEKDAANT